MPRETKKTIVSAQFPLAYRHQLEQRAAEHDRTLSAEVRRAIARYLAPGEAKEQTS